MDGDALAEILMPAFENVGCNGDLVDLDQIRPPPRAAVVVFRDPFPASACDRDYAGTGPIVTPLHRDGRTRVAAERDPKRA